MEGLSKALMKLYEESKRPDDAIRYIRNNMCNTCPTDEEYDKVKCQLIECEREICQLRHELSSLKGNLKRTPSEIDMLLESGMSNIESDDTCHSLLKKFLTRSVFDELKPLKTSYGSTLLDVVKSGFDNHDSYVGIYAPDPEAYDVFARIFDPIIENYHGGFRECDTNPELNWGDPSMLSDLDPENEFIISTRVRCARCLVDHPFNPKIKEDEYKAIESEIVETLNGLDGEFKGTYYSLVGMEKSVQDKLIDDHFLFKEGDRFLQAAGATRFWPVGRGIFFNEFKTFLVWVNEEDHLRIISMECGGNLGNVYMRLVEGVEKIGEKLKFLDHPRLGRLTFCPTNLGTTIRASVHIQIPKLAANFTKLEAVANDYNLQVRGSRGEHSETNDGVYDISNKRRLGLTEIDAVKEMYDGISAIIKLEKELQ